MKHISSHDNPSFKRLRDLAHSGRERRKQARTVLDGVHLAQAYRERLGEPELLAVSERGLAQPEIRRFAETAGAPVLVLADALFDEASPVDAPSGLLAVVPIPAAPAQRVPCASCVVLDGIQDAGNVGSILRTAAAAGIGTAVLGAGCAGAWSPRVLRAGMGAHFGLVLHERSDPAQMLDGFAGSIVATAMREGSSVFCAALREPVAWLFGAEGAGLSPALRALAGEVVHIPMPGTGESLNVAAAAAVCLFEQVRRRAAG